MQGHVPSGASRGSLPGSDTYSMVSGWRWQTTGNASPTASFCSNSSITERHISLLEAKFRALPSINRPSRARERATIRVGAMSINISSNFQYWKYHWSGSQTRCLIVILAPMQHEASSQHGPWGIRYLRVHSMQNWLFLCHQRLQNFSQVTRSQSHGQCQSEHWRVIKWNIYFCFFPLIIVNCA